jgi:hypothetical protein
MKYLCLVYLDEKQPHTVHDRECWQFAAGVFESGVCTAAEALQPSDTAATVRVRDGRTAVTDGPFAETVEQLAGFYLIDAPDLNDAIRIAAQIPPAREGSIEVRPVRQLQVD